MSNADGYSEVFSLTSTKSFTLSSCPSCSPTRSKNWGRRFVNFT